MALGFEKIKRGTLAQWTAATTAQRLIPLGASAAIVDANNKVIYTVIGDGVTDLFSLDPQYPVTYKSSSSNTVKFDKIGYVHGVASVLTGALVLDFENAIPLTNVVLIHNDATQPAFKDVSNNDYTLVRVSENNYYPTVDNYIVLTYIKADLVWVNYMQGVYVEGGNNAPVASNLSISGNLIKDQILTANYNYFDAESDLELDSVIKWYRADDGGGNEVLLKTSTEADKNYTLQSGDVGKVIRFSVQPNAASGTLNGNVVFSSYTAIVTGFYSQDVVWKDGTLDLAIVGNSITKTGGATEQGAISSSAIKSVTDGYFQFKLLNPGTLRVGISNDSNSSSTNSDINYKLRWNGSGVAGLVTDPVAGDTTISSNIMFSTDLFRFQITAGVVTFIKSSDNGENWTQLHEFATPITASELAPIYLDSSLATDGVSVDNARIGSIDELVTNPN